MRGKMNKLFIGALLLLVACASLEAAPIHSILLPVDVVVQDSSEAGIPYMGYFAVGYYDTLGTAYPLLFDYHPPDDPRPVASARSYVVIFVDGGLYINNYQHYINPAAPPEVAGYLSQYCVSASRLAGSTISTEFYIPIGGAGGIRVEQNLTPMVWPSTGEKTVRFEYNITNEDASFHTVGLLLVLDLLIQDEAGDRAPVQTGPFYTSTELMLERRIPQDWFAFHDTPGESTTTVGIGHVRRLGATNPSIFAIFDARTDRGIYPIYWDFDVDTTWEYGDVAVALRWDPERINPGERMDIVTYYGPGAYSIPPDTGLVLIPPTIDIGGVDCHLFPDTLDYLLLAQNMSSAGNPCDSVQVCIELPDGIYFIDTLGAISPSRDSCVYTEPMLLNVEEFGNAPFLLWIDASAYTSDTTVVIHSSASSVTAGFVPVDVYDTLFIPFISGEVPQIVNMSPAGCINCDSVMLSALISSVNPLDTLSIRFSINGHDTSGARFNPVSGRYEFSMSPLTNGQVIEYCVYNLVDIYGCRADSTCETITVDLEPPHAANPSPYYEPVADPVSPITVELVDTICGIFINSLVIEVQGETLSWPDARLHWDDVSGILTYTPFSPYVGDTVRVCIIDVRDNATLCGGNHLSPAPYCWEFYTDVEPPEITPILPVGGIFTSCPDQEIFISIMDRNGVDDSSIVLNINGSLFTIENPELTYNSSTSRLEFVPSGPVFSDGDIVTVSVDSACDSTGNCIPSPVTFSFRVDMSPPYLFGVPSPPPYGFVPFLYPDINVGITDDYSGVDPNSIRVSVNDIEVSWPHLGLSYEGDLLTISTASIPGFTPSLFDTVEVCILDIADQVITFLTDSHYCEANSLETDTCWTFYIDAEGPRVNMTFPPVGSVVSCVDSPIVLSVFDHLPIDTLSLQVRITTRTGSFLYPWGNPDLHYIPPSSPGDTGQIVIDPPPSYSSQDTIDVEILSLNDSIRNPVEPPRLWRFYFDAEPPWATPVHPLEPRVSHFDDIRIRVQDAMSPICVDSLLFRIVINMVDTFIFGVDTMGFYWLAVDSVLRIVPWEYPAFPELEDGDSLEVCLIRATDSLDFCDYNHMGSPVCWSFLMSLSGPTVRLLSPPDGSVISCDSFVITMLLRDGNGVIPDSVVFTYNTTEYTLSSYPSMTYENDTLIFPIPFPLSSGDMVTFGITQAYDSLYNPLDTVVFWATTVDLDPPVFGSTYPADGAVITDMTPDMSIELYDMIAGVLAESLYATITVGAFETTISFSDPALIYSSTDSLVTIFTDSIDGFHLSGGDAVTVCLFATDAVDWMDVCPPNADSFCFDFSLPADGPIVTPITPHPGWIISCPYIDTIVISIVDTDGVDESTIEIVLNGDTISWPDPRLSFEDSVLYFVPSPVITEDGRYDITVIHAMDSLGNDIGGGMTSWFFILDTEPPIAFNPEPTGVVTEIAPLVCVDIVDSSGILDTASLTVDITSPGVSLTAHFSDPFVSWSSPTLCVDPEAAGIHFAGGDTVSVCVTYASDMPDTCEPNVMEPYCWEFLIAGGGPVVNLASPEEGLILACVPPDSFIFTLADTDGVMESSIVMGVIIGEDTIRYPYGDPSIVVIESDTLDTLIFYPPGTIFSDGDTFEVMVLEATDELLNLPSSVPYTFYIDWTAPYVTGFYPPDGALWTDPTPDVWMHIVDDISDVDPDSIVFTVNETLIFTAADSPAIWYDISDSTLYFFADSVGLLFHRDDTVEFCLEYIQDAPDDSCPNPLDSAVCWSIIINQGGPFVHLISPAESTFICQDDSILIYLFDEDGVDDTTIIFSYCGVDYTIDSTAISFVDDSLLIFVPVPDAFCERETLEVSVFARDNLGYAAEGDTSWLFYMDLTPPEAVPVSPAPMETDVDYTPDITLVITDTFSPIDSTSIRLRINGVVYSVSTDTLTWDATSGTLTFSSTAAGIYFLAGSTVEVCLDSVNDLPLGGCSPNVFTDTLCWNFTIVITDGPSAIMISPHDSDFVSCDSSEFVDSILVLDPEGVIDTTVMIGIEVFRDGSLYYIDSLLVGTDTTIEFIGDTLVIFDWGVSFADGDTVRISLLSALDSLGNPADSVAWWFFVDYSPPYVESVSPDDGEFVSTRYPEIRAHFIDDIDDVDPYSVFMTITAGSSVWHLSVDSAGVVYTSDDTFVVDTRLAGIIFTGGDTVLVCIDSLSDSPDLCEPNWMDSSYCWEFYIPTGGPVVENILPFDLATTSCLDESIVVSISDPDGVEPDSIVIYVGGSMYRYPETSLRYENDTLVFNPSTPFSDGDAVVWYIVQAYDSLGNDVDSVDTFTFIVDHSVPVADFIFPTPGYITYDTLQDITFHIFDEITWVDTSYIVLTVDETEIPWGETGLYFIDGDTLIFSPEDYGLIFCEGETIDVSLYVRDTVDFCPANETTYTTSFYINDDDSLPPVFSELLPDSVRALTPFVITAYIVDSLDQSGVHDGILGPDDQGVFLVYSTVGPVDYLSGTYDGIIYMHYDSMLHIAESDTIVGYPEGTPFYFQIVAWDNDFDCAMESDRSMGVSQVDSVVFTNIEPPLVSFVYPHTGEFTSCERQEVVLALDDPNGINSSTIELIVNGQPHHTTSPGPLGTVELREYPYPVLDTLVFRPTDSWADAETVTVVMGYVEDNFGNAYTDSAGISFIVDLSPPVCYSSYPPDSTFFDPGEFTEIRFEVGDELSGVDPLSIVIDMNGNLYSMGTTPGLDYDNGTITVDIERTGFHYERGDTVWFSISDMTDNPTRYCEPNHLVGACSTWVFIKPITGCKVTPIPFTPNRDGYNDYASFDFPGRFDKEAVVKIYNMRNSLVREIHPEHFNYIWDGNDSSGNPCRQGVYIYVIERDGKVLCSGTVVIAR